MGRGAFQPLLERLGEGRQDFAPDEVRAVLLACGFGAAVLNDLREIFQGLLRRSLEYRKLRLMLEELTDTVELALSEIYPKARSLTAGGALPLDERLNGLRTLDEFSARAAAMRDHLAALARWLEKPAPAVDISLLTGAEAALEGKGYEDSKSIIARLREGSG
jgi:hypothetical protein